MKSHHSCTLICLMSFILATTSAPEFSKVKRGYRIEISRTEVQGLNAEEPELWVRALTKFDKNPELLLSRTIPKPDLFCLGYGIKNRTLTLSEKMYKSSSKEQLVVAVSIQTTLDHTQRPSPYFPQMTFSAPIMLTGKVRAFLGEELDQAYITAFQNAWFYGTVRWRDKADFTLYRELPIRMHFLINNLIAREGGENIRSMEVPFHIVKRLRAYSELIDQKFEEMEANGDIDKEGLPNISPPARCDSDTEEVVKDPLNQDDVGDQSTGDEGDRKLQVTQFLSGFKRKLEDQIENEILSLRRNLSGGDFSVGGTPGKSLLRRKIL